jgi:hypothetical protein
MVDVKLRLCNTIDKILKSKLVPHKPMKLNKEVLIADECEQLHNLSIISLKVEKTRG